MLFKKINYKSISSITLMVVNILLCLLAIILHWKLFDILFIFWAESLVIGLFSIFKMLKIQLRPSFGLMLEDSESELKDKPERKISPLFIFLKVVLIGSFGLVFFILSALQICFIYVLFGDYSLIEFVLGLMERKLEFRINDMESFLIGVSIIFVSHAISYYVNYLRKKEYETIKLLHLVSDPFKRIILVWIVIAAGSYVIVNFGKDSILLLIIFFAVKIFFDLRQHSVEHKKTLLDTDSES